MSFCKQLRNACAAIVFTAGMASAASANVISLYGDKDGLGIGVANGQAFNWTNVTAGASDAGTITDRWMFGTQTWSQTYSLAGAGSIVGASFEIFTGGQGWFGLSRLFIDNVFVGTLTDGDGADTGGDGQNRGRLDTFDLGAYLGLLNGSESIRVETVRSGDGWALDYSQLTIRTAAVPEPGALSLVALGLLGLGAARRRKTH